MSTYVFFTADIHAIGGMQMYVAGKSKYLRSRGWRVCVLYPGVSAGAFEISELERYRDGAVQELGFPPYACAKKKRSIVVSRICSQIINKNHSGKLIIESHDDKTSQWAELVAAQTSGKHICFLCNEGFRGKGKHYRECLDFYIFKYKRGELAVIKEESLDLLFAGHKNSLPIKQCVLSAACDEAVQDVECDELNNGPTADYTIAYVGRTSKGYVRNALSGIKDFAKCHIDKTVLLIIVGDKAPIADLLENNLNAGDNLSIICLGNRVPIPRIVYQRVDVVIAGAGCAWASAREQVPVIVPDANNYLANGILGIDTFNTLFHEGDCSQRGYLECLEDVLVEKKYSSRKPSLPERHSPDYYYDQHFRFIELSNGIPEYYPETRLCENFKLLPLKIAYAIKRNILIY